MQLADLVARVRQEIGDPLQSFTTIETGDGTTSFFNLPKSHISTSGFQVQITDGVQVNTLTLGTDYQIEFNTGELQLTSPVPNQSTLIVSGSAYAMYSDTDLQPHIADGVRWHVYNITTPERYQARDGWITYRDVPKNLENLPRIEEPLLVMRCALNVLWGLANDLATEMNVSTAEGTSLDHGELYGRIMNQIAALNDRYVTDCATLNVGPYRIEMLTQRRVSQTTGRLVPIYVDREYDDVRYPTRELPPVDRRYEDSSGIPSQIYMNGWQ